MFDRRSHDRCRHLNAYKHCCAGELKVGSPVARMARHANSALLAVACDDLSIRMFDVEVGLATCMHCTTSASHQLFASC
jgi:hypothetical protein